jgi:putative two-component system response regulator
VDSDLTSARILIVDDEPVNALLLRRILEAAGVADVEAFDDPEEALGRFLEAEASARPFDLVCTDLHMPRMSGADLIERIRRVTRDAPDFLPLLVLTADLSAEAEQDCLSRGASDFVTKPFKSTQIRLRVTNLLRTRALQRRLGEHNARLESAVKERTAELEAAWQDVLERLATAAEYRDATTGLHTQRVGRLSGLLADALGCDVATAELIRRAAPLHDVGKIAIPDRILLKPGPLSAAEYRQMQQHVYAGSRLLANGRSRLLAVAETIARTHHERWDGSGYPLGLRGDAIPMAGQIVAVTDVFDTLVSERPYKPAWPVPQALDEMRRLSGTWFAPGLVDALLAVLDANPGLIAEVDRAADGRRDDDRGDDREPLPPQADA